MTQDLQIKTAPAPTRSAVAKLTTSVVIPTFNRAQMLKECLAAIMAQTMQPFEILVVNDGSSDETQHVTASCAPSARVITQSNQGKSAALNTALEQVRGDCVWIIDDDDIVLPQALEILTSLLERAPDAGFAYGRHDRFNDHLDSTRKFLGTGYWQHCAPDTFLQATLEDLFVHQTGMLVRTSSYKRVGQFNVNLSRSQDYDMLLRLARHFTPAISDEVVFWQRQHSGRRGPLSDRFDVVETETKWIKNDQEIFRRVRQDWPLELFLATRRINNADEHRMALINRGVVLARRKLWREALTDLDHASRQSANPLSSDELSSLRRIFASKYGCAELLTPGAPRASILKFASTGHHSALTRAMARGLVWRIRESAVSGRIKHAAALSGLFWTLVR